MQQEAYFTRKYEGVYGSGITERFREVFESEAITETFFAVAAQIDLLVEEGQISLASGQYYNKSDWTVDEVLLAGDEVAAIARAEKSPMLVAIEKLVACMRRMYETAHLAPAGDFRDTDDLRAPEDRGDDAGVVEVRMTSLPEGTRTFRLRVGGRIAAEQPITIYDGEDADVQPEPEQEPEEPPEIPAAEAVHFDREVSALGTVECGLWRREAPLRTKIVGDVTCRHCRAMVG